MWQPDLGTRTDRRGMLHGSWQGAGRLQALVLLDPPRNAMEPAAYQKAQRNVARLYQNTPGDDPFIVGLQEDFWRELERRGGPEGGVLPERYLDEGGLGIVHALRTAETSRTVVRLEDPEGFDDYKQQENDATRFMTEAAVFLSDVAAAIKRAQRERCSPALTEFLARVSKQRATPLGGAGEHLTYLLASARSAGVDLKLPQYRSLVEYETQKRQEGEVKEDTVKAAREFLILHVQINAQPNLIRPRAAWEIYRSTLARRSDRDDLLEKRLAEIDQWLDRDELPAPPDEVMHAVKKEVEYACIEWVRVEPGSNKIDLLGGHGEQASNLLELAAVLGIPLSLHANLAAYIQYAWLANKLSHQGTANRVNAAAIELERELARRFTQSNADRVLAGFEPIAVLFEALGRYQLIHDERLRRTLLTMSVRALCETLDEMGAALPAGWRPAAEALDRKFDALRDYYDATVLRGKDVPSALVRGMKRHGVERGLLYCDGYLHTALSRWFEGHDVSYAFVVPRW